MGFFLIVRHYALIIDAVDTLPHARYIVTQEGGRVLRGRDDGDVLYNCSLQSPSMLP